MLFRLIGCFINPFAAVTAQEEHDDAAFAVGFIQNRAEGQFCVIGARGIGDNILGIVCYTDRIAGVFDIVKRVTVLLHLERRIILAKLQIPCKRSILKQLDHRVVVCVMRGNNRGTEISIIVIGSDLRSG